MHLRRWPRLLFFAVATLVILLDQGTKAWAASALAPVQRMVIVPDYLDLNYLRGGNSGIAFGLFQGHGWLVAFFMIGLAAVAVFYARELDWSAREPNLVGGCLVGGAVGNLVDRARLGHVVDFIDLHAGIHHWPTFNVADSMICIAVAWIVLGQLRSAPGEAAKTQQS